MTIYLLQLDQMPIFDQLQIEEALLRLDERNICLINSGSSPAIVMGISGKPEKLLDRSKVVQDEIPVIKRYSGGGTVVVDDSTLFVSFLFDKAAHSFPLFPEPIYRWSEDFYRQVFQNKEFSLRENDYLLGSQKCGGNAQYIRKNRFVHHTTFLWDFQDERMDYLLLPEKRPQYREDREHRDFLCRMKSHFPSKERFIQALISQLHLRYEVKDLSIKELEDILTQDHRKSTSLVQLKH